VHGSKLYWDRLTESDYDKCWEISERIAKEVSIKGITPWDAKSPKKFVTLVMLIKSKTIRKQYKGMLNYHKEHTSTYYGNKCWNPKGKYAKEDRLCTIGKCECDVWECEANYSWDFERLTDYIHEAYADKDEIAREAEEAGNQPNCDVCGTKKATVFSGNHEYCYSCWEKTIAKKKDDEDGGELDFTCAECTKFWAVIGFDNNGDEAEPDVFACPRWARKIEQFVDEEKGLESVADLVDKAALDKFPAFCVDFDITELELEGDGDEEIQVID
jgi:hypothetical protein